MQYGREQHSEDGSRYVERGPSGKDWDVQFDGLRVAGLASRKDARALIRALKADPALAAVALVQLS